VFAVIVGHASMVCDVTCGDFETMLASVARVSIIKAHPNDSTSQRNVHLPFSSSIISPLLTITRTPRLTNFCKNTRLLASIPRVRRCYHNRASTHTLVHLLFPLLLITRVTSTSKKEGSNVKNIQQRGLTITKFLNSSVFSKPPFCIQTISTQSCVGGLLRHALARRRY